MRLFSADSAQVADGFVRIQGPQVCIRETGAEIGCLILRM
jgi:hypothetical protein